jgi:hypothetical protein
MCVCVCVCVCVCPRNSQDSLRAPLAFVLIAQSNLFHCLIPHQMFALPIDLAVYSHPMPWS